MTGHTYLMKSRHGVYYLRLVLRKNATCRLGPRTGELRLSLRTKTKELAKSRLLEKLRVMKINGAHEPWKFKLITTARRSNGDWP